MSVVELENAISKLSQVDADELLAWFADHHEKLWDREIEDDLDSGRLDSLLLSVDVEIDSGNAERL